MGWDADLVTFVGGKQVKIAEAGDWNYTHNTNAMISAALEDAGKGDAVGSAWWNKIRGEKGDYWCTALDGLSGADGEKLLGLIVAGLEADPGRFRAMNPPNKWGDYDGLLDVLGEMRKASGEWPEAVWSIS